MFLSLIGMEPPCVEAVYLIAPAAGKWVSYFPSYPADVASQKLQVNHYIKLNIGLDAPVGDVAGIFLTL